MADLQLGGEIYGGDGTQTPPTKGPTGAQRVQLTHGEYYDRAARGYVYAMTSGAVTAAAAHVTGSALGTIKFVCGLANPPGSGYNIAILRSAIATVSGTPGGPCFYDYYSGVTINSTATGSIRSTLLNRNSAGDSIAHPQTDVAVTTVGGATANCLTLGLVGGPAAIAAGAGNNSLVDEVRGSIIIPPGSVFGITVTAAGTTHVLRGMLVWEEVKLLS